MLESDKAENFASLFEGTATAGFEVWGFSAMISTGFTVSGFVVVRLLLFTALVSLITESFVFLETSAIE